MTTTVFQRTKPRLRVLTNNAYTTESADVASYGVTPGVVIKSGQICSVDVTTGLLVLGWVNANQGPFIANNDSGDRGWAGTGIAGSATLPQQVSVYGFNEHRVFQTGYYDTVPTYTVNDALIPDGTTGNITKALTATPTATVIGFCTTSRVRSGTAPAVGVNENTAIVTTSMAPTGAGYMTPVVNIINEESGVTPVSGAVNVLTFKATMQLPTSF